VALIGGCIGCTRSSVAQDRFPWDLLWALTLEKIGLFFELIIFMDKIILEKSRISSYATKNTPKALKIRKKFSEIL